MAIIKGLYTDETGATGIEYGFLASLIAMAMMSGFEALGNEVENTFGYIDEEYARSTGQ